MTDESMAPLEMVEQQADGDLVREVPAFAADRVMEAEVETRTGTAKGARSPSALARMIRKPVTPVISETT